MIARLPWLAALALSACAQLPASSNPPVCDGRHRRPANLYGSVLTPPPPTQLEAMPAPDTPGSGSAPGGFGSCP